MPHIHTETGQHDLTVAAYIIRIDMPQPKALLHMHRKLERLLPVGGHVELNETPWQALAHEVEEESGYRFTELKVLQPKRRLREIRAVVQHPYPLSINTHEVTEGHFHTDIQYAFRVTASPTQSASEGESLDLRWVTQDEMNALSEDLIYLGTKDIYNFMFDEVVKNWEEVPTNSFGL